MQHMFIISTPMISLLKMSKYHLVLPHLYKSTAYLETYKRFSREGDFLLQDNSIFELKDCCNGDLLDFGKQIGASCIMTPEVLRDSKACIERTEAFLAQAVSQRSVEDPSFTFAAAVQGKNYQEIKEHYLHLSRDARIAIIAIPFNFEFDAYGCVSEEKKQAGWNRFSIIQRLLLDKVWDCNKKHHLLGLYNPAELSCYHAPDIYFDRFFMDDLDAYDAFLDSILSNDSSSCYWHSLYGCSFYEESGLLYKKIESHVDFDSEFTSTMQKVVYIKNVGVILGYITGTARAFNLIKRYQSWLRECA